MLVILAILFQAVAKHAECKAVIEKQEQDTVRLKLKHQLEMKVGTRLCCMLVVSQDRCQI